MSRLTASTLLAESVDTTAVFADADARRMAELDAALGLKPRAVCPLPSPEMKDPIMADDTETNSTARTCARKGCDRKLRSDNKKGVCANRKTCGGTGPAPAADDDDTLMGERVERRKAKATRIPSSAGGVERLRQAADLFGFDADAILDQLAGEWLETVATSVREAVE